MPLPIGNGSNAAKAMFLALTVVSPEMHTTLWRCVMVAVVNALGQIQIVRHNNELGWFDIMDYLLTDNLYFAPKFSDFQIVTL